MKINNLTNNNKKVIAQKGPFQIIEHQKDLSVSPGEAVGQYFMSEMNVKRRQVFAIMKGEVGIITQAGAMQWTVGNVESVTGVTGTKDLLGKLGKSMVTSESTIKPEYRGRGFLMLEPTYKYIILVDMKEHPEGLVIEDGLFLAAERSVKLSIQSRRSLSSVAGGEGLFNTKLVGEGIVALESNVPYEELIEFELNNETLKIDGNMAVAWSPSLQFTLERSSKSLIGSAINKEGLVNVFRGTGKILMSPVANAALFKGVMLDNVD